MAGTDPARTGRADDGGDPRRRAFAPDARLPADAVRAWTPTPGERVTPNRPLVEALYCPEHGFRPESAAWVCSDLRDDGGYLTAHAAWILALVVDSGCLPRAATCLDGLRDELLVALARGEPLDTLAAVDLHAERVLFGLLAGAPRDALAPAVERLRTAQRPDGSFAEGDSWPATHATLAATWALAAYGADQAPR